jgi:hypothetical protein
MGDRLGIHGAVDLFKQATMPWGPTLQELSQLKSVSQGPVEHALLKKIIFHKALITRNIVTSVKCLRPYHVEYTSSRPITEVKQH